MKKRTVCQTATILFSLLAVVLYFRSDAVAAPWPTHKLLGTALSLLSAICFTQWIEYQKRHEATSAQPGWPVWVRRLLFSSSLFMTVLAANAQTNWTRQEQMLPSNGIYDVTYGAGRYVAVGQNGIIRVSTDGIAWKTQVDGLQSPLNIGLKRILYAKNLFVAVGSSGQVITSADGLNWVKRVSNTGESLNSIAYSGGLFIAVGRLGTAIKSADGINWTNLTTGTTIHFNDIVYAGSRFVAVGDGGMIRTTPNGTIWTQQQSGTSEPLSAITTGPTGNLVSIGIFDVILTSADGLSWKKQENVVYPIGQYVYYSGIFYNKITGRYIINVGGPDKDQLTSIDGLNWTASSSGSTIPFRKVYYFNGKLIGVGAEKYIGYSANGLTWKWPMVTREYNLYSAAYGNGHYVAVGEDPSEENRSRRSNVALVSEDGKSYGIAATIQLADAGRCFYDVAFGAGVFVTVGEDGIIQSSLNGKEWFIRSMVVGQTLRGITYGGGQFIAIGDKGFLCRSVDGVNWTNSYIGLADQFNSITYANGQFVAVGEWGALATSPNGIIWTARTTNTKKQLKSVTFGNNTWVAVGYDGLVCWSVDGVNWSSFIANSSTYFNQVLFANNQFVTVSLDGKIHTSTTAFGWTARQSTVSAHLYGLTYNNGLFVAVGVSGTIVTSPQGFVIVPRQGRVGATEPEVGLRATTYPNPVEENFTVAIDGATGQAVRLWLMDGQGRTIEDRQIQVEQSLHQEPMQLGQRAPGLYLLRVSTADQTQTVKVLKH